MCCCIVVGTIEPRDAVSFRFYMNHYSQRLGGVPKHLSSTQPWGRSSLYKLWLLKSTNLPVSFFLESQPCGLPWLLSRQCVDSTWDRLRTVYQQVFRVIILLHWSAMQVITMLEWGFRPRDPQHLTLSVVKLHPPSCLPFLWRIKVILQLSAVIFTRDSQTQNGIVGV